jgi:hypothetical protein
VELQVLIDRLSRLVCRGAPARAARRAALTYPSFSAAAPCPHVAAQRGGANAEGNAS